MTNIEIANKVRDMMSYNRFEHTLRVKEMALQLARHYEVDNDKVEIAAIIHDCAKDFNHEKTLELCKSYNVNIDDLKEFGELIHAELGAKIAEIEFGITDDVILNSIKYHTTGRKNMTTIDKIIYLADVAEPQRRYDGVEKIRELSFVDLDRAMAYSIDLTLQYLISRKVKIHPITVEARNFILDIINR